MPDLISNQSGLTTDFDAGVPILSDSANVVDAFKYYHYGPDLDGANGIDGHLKSLSDNIDNLIPSQSGQSGKFLTTNGTVVSWETPPATTWGSITGTLSNQTDLNSAFSEKAPLQSPIFTGIPEAPTATAGTNTTQIATTAFVTTALSSFTALPSQTGNTGKYLTTNGTTLSWFAHEENMIISVSDETTAIEVGTSKITFRVPFAMTLTKIPRASLAVASTSGDVAIDINKNGTSIFSTTLSIDANEKTSVTAASPAVLSTTSVADDDEITIDIDSSGTGAKGLKIILYYSKA